MDVKILKSQIPNLKNPMEVVAMHHICTTHHTVYKVTKGYQYRIVRNTKAPIEANNAEWKTHNQKMKERWSEWYFTEVKKGAHTELAKRAFGNLLQDGKVEYKKVLMLIYK